MSVSYDPSDPNSTQTDPTNIGQPSTPPPPSSNYSSTERGYDTGVDIHPTDLIGQAAATEPTDTSKKTTYDPSNPDSSVTDQIGQPAAPKQSDAAATDQSNLTQASAPITSDPTDQIGQPDQVNRGEQSASLHPTDQIGLQVNRGEQSAALTNATPYAPPEYVNRAERPEIQPNTGETPGQSTQITDALGAVNTAKQGVDEKTVQQIATERQQESGSLHGEQLDITARWDDLNRRWDDYVDAVKSGQQARDPQFEASVQGEMADLQTRSTGLQSRVDAYLNRDLKTYYADRFPNADTLTNNPAVAAAIQRYQDTVGTVGNAIGQRNALSDNSYFGVSGYQTSPHATPQQGGQLGADWLATTVPGFNGAVDPNATVNAYTAGNAFRQTYGYDYDPNNPRNPLDFQRYTEIANAQTQANIGARNQQTLNQPMSTGAQIVRAAAVGDAYLAMGASGVLLGGPVVSVGNLIATVITNGLPSHFTVPEFVPGVGGKNIPVPDVMQHLMGAFLADPTAFITTDVNAFRTLFSQGPQAAGAQVVANVRGAFTQTPEQYAIQQGIQDIGVIGLAANVVGIHNPGKAIKTSGWDGLSQIITLSNPVTHFENGIQTLVQQGVPFDQAVTQMYDAMHNRVFDILWQLAPFNPMYRAVSFPVFEKALAGLLSTTTSRAIDAYAETGTYERILKGAGGEGVRPFSPTGAGMRFADQYPERAAGQFLVGDQAAKAILADRPGGLGKLTDLWVGNAATRLAEINTSFLPSLEDTAMTGGMAGRFYRGAESLATGDVRTAQAIAQEIESRFGGTASSNYSLIQQITTGMAKEIVDRNVGGANLRTVADLAGAKAGQFEAGTFTDRQLRTAARANNLDLPNPRTMTDAQAGQLSDIQGFAAREVLASDIRAAWYAHAGVALPGTEHLAVQGVAGLANLVRALLLASSAPVLALQKFTDEYGRGFLKGVIGIRASDTALGQAGARFTEKYNVFGQSGRASDFLASGTAARARQEGMYLPGNLQRPPQADYGIANAFMKTNRYGEAMSFADRLKAIGGAPARALDKWNQSLIQAPTQHVLLNSAYQEIKGFANGKEAIARDVMKNILQRTGDHVTATAAYDALVNTRGQDQFLQQAHRIDSMFPNMGAADAAATVTNPRAPSFGGQSRMSPVSGPNNRLGQDIATTGGEPGIVRDATQPTARGPVAEPIPGRSQFANYTNEQTARVLEINQRLREQPPPDEYKALTQERGQIARDVRAAFPASRPPADIAAGDGGGMMGSRVRSAKQQALDQAARPYRNEISDILSKGGTLDQRAELLARTNPGEVTSKPGKAWDDRVMLEQMAVKSELGRPNLSAHELAELTGHERALADIRGPVNPDYAARSKTFNEPRIGPAQDVTDQIGQPAVAAPHPTDQVGQAAGKAYAARPSPEIPQGPGERLRTMGDQIRETFRPGVSEGSSNRLRPTGERVGEPSPGRTERPIRSYPGTGPTELQDLPHSGDRGQFENFMGGMAPNYGPNTAARAQLMQGVPMQLAPPRDMASIAAAYRPLGGEIRQAGEQFAGLQRQTTENAIQRGYGIVGNPSDQTLLGHLLQNGVGIIPPVLPFAPFHIHSSQFWAEYLVAHPVMAYGLAQAIDQLDDYGKLQLPGGLTVSGLIKLTTGAHLVDWLMKGGRYAGATAQIPGINPLQWAAKNVAYNAVGNNSFVRPFPYVTDPAQALVQQNTPPLTTAKGRLDPREVYSESGAMAGTSGAGQLLNTATGSHIPRNVVTGATNPGQALGNVVTRGLSNLTGSNLKPADPMSQLPYDAPAFVRQQGWDVNTRGRAAVTDASTQKPVTADGKALLDWYQNKMDTAALGRLAPVQVTQRDTYTQQLADAKAAVQAAREWGNPMAMYKADQALKELQQSGNAPIFPSGTIPSQFGGVGRPGPLFEAPNSTIPVGQLLPAPGTYEDAYQQGLEERFASKPGLLNGTLSGLAGTPTQTGAQQNIQTAPDTSHPVRGPDGSLVAGPPMYGKGSPQDVAIEKEIIALRENYPFPGNTGFKNAPLSENATTQRSISAGREPLIGWENVKTYGLELPPELQAGKLEVMKFENKYADVQQKLTDAGYYTALNPPDGSAPNYPEMRRIAAGIPGGTDYVNGLATLKEQVGYPKIQLLEDQYLAAHPDIKALATNRQGVTDQNFLASLSPRPDNKTASARFTYQQADPAVQKALVDEGNLRGELFRSNPTFQDQYDAYNNMPATTKEEIQAKSDYKAAHPDLFNALSAIDARVSKDDNISIGLARFREQAFAAANPGFGFDPSKAYDPGYLARQSAYYETFTPSQRAASDAWDAWKQTPEGKAYAAMETAQRAAGPFGSPQEKAWYQANQAQVVTATNARNAAIKEITQRTGVNPIEVSNILGGLQYPDFQKSNPTPKDLILRGTGGGGTGGYSAAKEAVYQANKKAGDDFYGLYNGLTKQEKAIVHEAITRDGLSVFGAKGVTASTYERALTVAHDALSKKTTAAGATGGGFQALRSVPMSLADAQLLARGIVPSDYWSQLGQSAVGLPRGHPQSAVGGYPSYGATSSNPQSNYTRNQPTSNVRTFTPTRPSSLPGANKSRGRPPAA